MGGRGELGQKDSESVGHRQLICLPTQAMMAQDSTKKWVQAYKVALCAFQLLY